MSPQSDRLGEIRARLEKATKGPWRFVIMAPRRRKHTIDAPLVHDGSLLIGAVAPGHQIRANPPGGSYPSSDGEFIAHAREDIPYLLDALATAERERDELGHEVTRLNRLGETWEDYVRLREERDRLSSQLATAKRGQRETQAKLENMAIECGEAQGLLRRSYEERGKLSSQLRVYESELAEARAKLARLEQGDRHE